jgi:hypothetical protein
MSFFLFSTSPPPVISPCLQEGLGGGVALSPDIYSNYTSAFLCSDLCVALCSSPLSCVDPSGHYLPRYSIK